MGSIPSQASSCMWQALTHAGLQLQQASTACTHEQHGRCGFLAAASYCV